MTGKFALTKTGSGQFAFNLKAGNGETILTSELYKAKASAQNGIESVKVNASIDSHFDRRTSKDGKSYFVLKAANGEIIGTSEQYSSLAAMENGVASVKTNAATASIEDKT